MVKKQRSQKDGCNFYLEKEEMTQRFTGAGVDLLYPPGSKSHRLLPMPHELMLQGFPGLLGVRGRNIHSLEQWEREKTARKFVNPRQAQLNAGRAELEPKT